MSAHGSEEAVFCQHQRISVNMLSHVWHASSMEALVEHTLTSLNFPEVHPIGMSQQFESRRNNPRKILYVQGSTISSLFFRILAPVWDTAVCFIELNLRVCPNALLSQIQAEYHPRIFSEFFSLIPTEHLSLLSILQRLAGATHPLTRGWLGYFSLQDCDLIESLGPVPWDTLVNPLWDKIVAAIDRSWHEARHQILNLRASQETPAPSACQDAALEESAAEYQYYRQKALVYGEVTPNFNSLQNCPGNSYSAFQSSSASKEEGEDEAEYRDYRQRALALPHMPPLESLVCLGSPQPSLLAQVAAVGFQFGKTSQALDPVSPFRLGKPQITNETMDTKILGKNPSKALRVLVAESLLQPMLALERPTASPLSAASLEHALSGPLTKETREHAPVSPVTEKMLEKVRVSYMTEQPREHVHPCPLRRSRD